jgi:hypothetical protein
MAVGRIERHRRQQLAFDQIDLMPRGLLEINGLHDIWMLSLPNGHGLI